MYVVSVSIKVKPERIEDFKAATRRNHEGSVREPGCLRFDVLQNAEDETHFMLYEVYRTPEDFEAHKQTPHFFQWRDAAEPMMAEPRTRNLLYSLFPDPWK
ncbi:MAG: antibiotic biosynthesis monooxygenase [Armatimonadetes bacterium]|nr:antibiotic biosynthesis monooxygenase [Armatimonadota bacterium]